MIKNFRGIEDIELKNCKKINIILGKNNTCKTSILEAIEFMSEPTNFYSQGEIIARNPFFRTKLLENFLHAFRMKDIETPIEISISSNKKHNLKIFGEIEEGYRESKEKREIREIRNSYIHENKEDVFILKSRILNVLKDSIINGYMSQLELEEIDFINKIILFLDADKLGKRQKIEEFFGKNGEIKKCKSIKVDEKKRS